MKTILATLITAAIVGVVVTMIMWPELGFLVFLLIFIGTTIVVIWRIAYDVLTDVLQ